MTEFKESTDRFGPHSNSAASAADALRDEAVAEFSPRNNKLVEERVELVNTRVDEKPQEKAKEKVGPTDPNKEITATIMVRSKASDEEMDRTLEKITRHEIKPLTDEEFNQRFGADPEAMKRVLKFAEENNLTVQESDINSGKVLLKGKVKDFNEAFKIQLDDFKGPLGISRERTGTISVPRSISTDVLGVFGLESKNLAHSNVQKLPQPEGKFSPRTTNKNIPSDAAKAYEFPTESTGAGQGVAILQFGGSIDLKDNAAYYEQRGLKVPDINIVTVDHGKMKPGETADDEVALDSQVIGTVAPDAKQMILFAPNSDQGFLDAVTRATFTKPGEVSNSAISISWGAPESKWSKQAMENLHLAFKKAALKGISVFAATGDNGARNETDRFTSDYPASDSLVIATGGTELKLTAEGKLESETSWKGSGGGISETNGVPDFQKETKLPENANKNGVTGRGVPDIAGNANPSTGYQIRVHGFESTMGGTSAVAPLYAGMVLRMNSILGQRVGFLNPYLYKNGNTDIFRDMTAGDNGGYNAGPGWDAVTGWGVINGTKLLEKLKVDMAHLK